MACSKCGQKGHYAPNCPNQPKDNAFQGRIDGLTESQSEKIERDFQRSKKKHAPDSRATAVRGKSHELPGLIQKIHRKLLGSNDD